MRTSIPLAVFIALFLAMAAGVASAGTIADTRIVQPDGTVVEVKAMDEWTVTETGYAVVQDASTGWWHYAVRGESGALVPGGVRLGLEKPDSAAIRDHVLPQMPASWNGPAMLRPSNL